MTPRAGAVAEGKASRIVYLLLERVERGGGPRDFLEDCWLCLTLARGKYTGVDGVVYVREEWLLNDAEELT